MHSGHDRHAGHSVAMFRDRFWLSLALTVPVVLWSSEVQHWLGYRAPVFWGSRWIPAILGTIVFLYGGSVFILGAWGELSDRRPGMMTLISRAIVDPARSPHPSPCIQTAAGLFSQVSPSLLLCSMLAIRVAGWRGSALTANSRESRSCSSRSERNDFSGCSSASINRACSHVFSLCERTRRAILQHR